jgi:phosphatidylglycerophosphatase A
MLSKVKSQKLKVKSFILFVFCFLFFEISGYSQCAMCRASLESSGEVTQAQAVNDGIVYLMAIPYILVGIVGFYIYRMYNKKKKV